MSTTMDWDHSGTASDRIQKPDPETDETRHSQLLLETGELRDRSRVLNDDVRSLDRRARREMLNDQANALTANGLTDLLHQMRSYGFAWQDIASVVEVSVPALRKWRRGSSASPENLQALARAVAACEMIRPLLSPTQGVAPWFQLPLAPHHLTRLDLYADDRVDELFDLAAGHMAATQVLDEVRPAWRDELDGFEVMTASDGLPAIVRRDG